MKPNSPFQNPKKLLAIQLALLSDNQVNRHLSEYDKELVRKSLKVVYAEIQAQNYSIQSINNYVEEFKKLDLVSDYIDWIHH